MDQYQHIQGKNRDKRIPILVQHGIRHRFEADGTLMVFNEWIKNSHLSGEWTICPKSKRLMVWLGY